MKTKVVIVTLIYVALLISMVRYIKRSLVIVKSTSFEKNENDSQIMLGKSNISVPRCGNGMYAVSIKKGFFRNSVRTLHMGVLRPDNFETQLEKMDIFFEKNKKWGASVFTIHSTGTTHVKPTLELMRTGIIMGSYPKAEAILKKYNMVKFIGLTHGCRQPYVMIMNVKTNVTTEKTGFLGATLVSRTFI